MTVDILVPIVVALITGVMAFLGVLVSNNSTQRVTAYKIDELKRDFCDLRDKVERHNGFSERIVALEQGMKAINKRIDGMKGGN